MTAPTPGAAAPATEDAAGASPPAKSAEKQSPVKRKREAEEKKTEKKRASPAKATTAAKKGRKAGAAPEASESKTKAQSEAAASDEPSKQQEDGDAAVAASAGGAGGDDDMDDGASDASSDVGVREGSEDAPSAVRAKRRKTVVESSDEESDIGEPASAEAGKESAAAPQRMMASFFGPGAASAGTESAPASGGASGAAGGAGGESSTSKPAGKAAKLDAKAAAASMSGFNPVEFATWKQEKPVPYAALAATFEKIEPVTKRLEIQRYLCELFRAIIATTPQDLISALYLCCNRLAPAYENLELGIGDSILIKAICSATGRQAKDVKMDYEEEGDLGVVTEHSRANQRTLFQPAPLTVAKVLKTFREIARMSGTKSQDKKQEKIKALLVASKGVESRYIVRGLQGKLRIGLAERTAIVSLAHAVTLTPPSKTLPPPLLDLGSKIRNAERLAAQLEAAVNRLQQAYSECPCQDKLVAAMLELGGTEGLQERCHLLPGIPVAPMLAKPTKGVTEVLDRFQGVKFTCEWKYDGERAQVHMLPDGTIKIFSRNSEDTTGKYPDLAEALREACPASVTSCVVDGEVVAYDREKQALLPFQVLSTRARKGATIDNVKVQVIYCAFDILYLNDTSLLRNSLRERRDILRSSLTEVEGRVTFAQSHDGADTEELNEFLAASVKGNCEGLMVKTLDQDATYEPSKRSLNWLKLKKDYMDGVGDTLDLVPVAAFSGKGKRTGTFGAYLLACWDEENEEFQAICKIGTGFSDEVLESHTKFFKENDHVREKPPVNLVYGDTLQPDVWLNPVVVWEVRAADLSISPVHKAALGLVDPGKGIALRFPRFMRIRDDKSPEQATNASQVAQMYRDQGLATQTTGGEGMDDDDDLL